MRRLACLALLALAGCETTAVPPAPEVRTVEVKIPVPVPCNAKAEKPDLIDADAVRKDKAKPDAAWVQALKARDVQLTDYTGALEAGFKACGGTVVPAGK